MPLGALGASKFDQEIVVLNVRWYVTYKLSYRDLVAMMGERGIDIAHTTILRWVQHYTPEFQKPGTASGPILYCAVDKRGPDRGFLPQPEARCKRR